MSDLFLGIDLGGTTIKAGAGDHTGCLLASDSTPTQSHLGPEGVVARIDGLAKKLLREVGVDRYQGVGVGVPGLVDLASGVTRFLPNFPTQWRDVPVARWLGASLDCPVRLLNDVRTATLGELTAGHGKDDPTISLAFFSIGTGIGGGVIIDGRLRLGSLGAAGELGHQTMIPDGPRCGCGNRGCLEILASGPAIASAGIRLMRMGLAPRLHELVGGDADRVTTQQLVEASEQDARIAEVIADASRLIGIAAANVVTTLHPDMVVLGGGVSEMGELLRQPVREEIQRRVGMFPTDDVRVETSMLGEQAGLIGALALARGDGLPT